MKRDKPIFGIYGVVCVDCPLDGDDARMCGQWWELNRSVDCPTEDNYAAACTLADQIKGGE